jgi:anti-anti-sigma factor
MAGVNYIDSKGLGALFSLSRHVEDLGHHIYFCELSTPVQEVFELAGLEHLLRIYGTEPEARKAISLMKTGGGAKPSS